MAVTEPIVIVGGGALGSSIAMFLMQIDPSRKVVVIEKDPTYTTASSALSTSSLRQQFSTPVSIALSQFGYQFMSSNAEIASQVSLTPRGYLFLSQARREAELRERTALARAHGAKIREYDGADLARAFPWMQSDDLTYAAQGLEGEGWFDGYSLMQLYRTSARKAGAVYRQAEVVDLDALGDRVTAVVLKDGTRVAASQVVNAAGPWAGKLAALLGLEIPVKARRRTAFMVSCPQKFQDFPILMDITGIYVRPEQGDFILNLSPDPEDDHDDLPLDPDFSIFDEKMWPVLAERIPAFEALRVERAWAGYYEYNTFDQNGLVGRFGYENFYLATGFSGHGLMHSAGVGRGVAELLTRDKYQSIDLTSLSPDRFIQNKPIVEKGVY